MKRIILIALIPMWGILTAHAASPGLKSVLIKDVPHVRQKPDFCGEACVEMALRKLGQDIDQDQVFNLSGVDPAAGRGCWTKGLRKAVLSVGFDPGTTWFKIPVKRALPDIDRAFAALHRDLASGVPSIVCMRTKNGPGATEHFRLALGYDAKTDELIYHEPAEANGAYHRMKRASFLELWPLKYEKNTWTVIRLRLAPKRILPLKKAEGFTAADYAQHMQKLKTRVPDKSFTVILQPPWVVIGDESPSTVKQRAETTIKRCTEQLKEMYFKKDPDHIIDVWLFKDKTSYDKHCWSVFKLRPTTPFGFSSPENRALIMNIGTGGGTLVHEMVHPLMAENFPECPSWFNEGMGSLYEQCGTKAGKLVGFTNWRLAGLQKGIRAKDLPSFKSLTSTTTHEFYSRDPGYNYAQSRYLLYYLQERGLLEKYYHAFVANHKTDPTGFETLKTMFKVKDMEAWQKAWEKYVMKLRFP